MNLSGIVMFNPSGSGNRNDSLNVPIANVPVVLQELSKSEEESCKQGVAVKTDLSGRFTITEVPPGSYRLIEAWGYIGAENSIVSFNKKTYISAIPADPDTFKIKPDGNIFHKIYSVSPNERIITLTDFDYNNLYFLDAPVADDNKDFMDEKPFENQIPSFDVNEALIPSHWNKMSQDHALFISNESTHVYEHGPIRLMENRLLYSSSIRHEEGAPYIYLPKGNYYIHYQTTSFYYQNCTSHEIRIDLSVNHTIYSGATSRTVSPPTTPVTVSGAALISNDTEKEIAVALVNHSKIGVWFSDTSVSIIKLR